MNINVREHIDDFPRVNDTPLIREKRNSSEGAFQRLQILRKTRKLLDVKLNETDTAFMPKETLESYAKLNELFFILMAEENTLITRGE